MKDSIRGFSTTPNGKWNNEMGVGFGVALRVYLQGLCGLVNRLLMGLIGVIMWQVVGLQSILVKTQQTLRLYTLH